MDRLFILFQYITPQHWLSRAVGLLAHIQQPRWFVHVLIMQFVKYFKVDMTEAAEPEPSRYLSFNEFFTRPLRPDARMIEQADVVCPADGCISQIGTISDGFLLQAKGKYFSAAALLADEQRAVEFAGGDFATIYLSPRDYHRVHMPLRGRLTASCYVPGDLFSVNDVTAQNVDQLFARNERLVCHFDTARGPMVMVLVGAMIVAGIETVWSGRVAPPPRRPQFRDYLQPPDKVVLEQGAEMGRFLLGSTVILMFPKGTVAWSNRFAPSVVTQMGESLASFVET